MGDSCPGFLWYGSKNRKESLQLIIHVHGVSLQFYFHPFVDKANFLKKNYLRIILFLGAKFDTLPPVSFGKE